MAFKSRSIFLSIFVALAGLLFYRYKDPSSRGTIATEFRRSMMRLFRDVSRFKSKVRLHQGNPLALIPIIFETEEDLIKRNRARKKKSGEGVSHNHHDMTDRFPSDFTMTLEELSEMNGATQSTPVYVSVRGLIFDVSAGRDVYGPGKSYHPLVAKEATAMYATGCLGEDDCKDKMATYVITPEDIGEVEKWVDFYANHEKYTYVGRLLNYDFMDQIVAMELQSKASSGEKKHS